LFARAVCEKLRVWTCRPDAASRRKPGENIVKSDPPKQHAVYGREIDCFAAAWARQWRFPRSR
jgi:hypothetical protein